MREGGEVLDNVMLNICFTYIYSYTYPLDFSTNAQRARHVYMYVQLEGDTFFF